MQALTVKKTAMPTMSSRTAIGRSVSVTGPRVWNSCTIESAGAGAVASAMPPKANARYTGTPRIRKTTAKTSETMRNVPSDWVSVVIISAFP